MRMRTLPVVEGTLTVSVNGKVYTANPGIQFFPKGAKVEFGSPNKMKRSMLHIKQTTMCKEV